MHALNSLLDLANPRGLANETTLISRVACVFPTELTLYMLNFSDGT